MGLLDQIKETVQGWFGSSADDAAAEAQEQASTVEEASEEAASVADDASTAASETADDAEDAVTEQAADVAGVAEDQTGEAAEIEEVVVVEEDVEEVIAETTDSAAEMPTEIDDAAEDVVDESAESVEETIGETPAAAEAAEATDSETASSPAGSGDKIEEIEGIGPAYRDKLAGAGIATTGDLLEKCGDRKGRDEVAEATGLSTGQLLKWANLADLMRINGVGGEFSELLEAAGVDTVKELRRRNAENLTNAMQVTNEERKLTRRVPVASQVQGWIDQAKEMEPMISH